MKKKIEVKDLSISYGSKTIIKNLNIDVFVFEDGVVHHISNTFRKFVPGEKSIAAVKDCKIVEKDIDCIDSKTNTRKLGFCNGYNRPKMPKFFLVLAAKNSLKNILT